MRKSSSPQIDIPCLEVALDRLSRQVERLLDSRFGPRGLNPQQVACVTVPLGSFAVPIVQSLGPLALSVYWKDREGAFEFAGFGVTHSVVQHTPGDLRAVCTAVRRHLSPLFPAVRFFGGIRFDPERSIDPEWNDFKYAWFAVPRLFFERRGGRTFLTCTVLPDQDRSRRAALTGMLKGLEIDSQPPWEDGLKPQGRLDNPDRLSWDNAVGAALTSFSQGKLEKIVLARRTTLKFSRTLNPVAVAERLSLSGPKCFHFFFRPGGAASAFLGASPERLYRRVGGRIWSESLAGTRRRGRAEREDRELEKELLSSRKELLEHRYVVEAIDVVLREFCCVLSKDQTPRIAKLQDVQHLLTRFCGTLKRGIGDCDLLAGLHPTPAVGGVPRTYARRRIRELEPFDRGWYAGPIGWISAEAAEFAVALRSALLQRDIAHLYAGAGIVEGSTADGEWSEIQQKVQWFIELLAGHGDLPSQSEQSLGRSDC